MKKKLLFLPLLLLINCERQEPEKGVIVRVGSEKLTEDDLKLFGISETQMEGDMNKALIENWVKSTLFYLAAKKEGLDRLPEMRRKLKWSERSILAQEYLSRKLKEVRVEDSEIEDVLKRGGDLFSEGVDLLIIFFSDSVRGEGIIKALKQRGRRYRRELLKLREDPDVSVMQTGMVNLGSFIYEFEGIPEGLKGNITRMKKGEVSDIYPAEEGYVLIKVLNRQSLEVDEEKTKEFLRQILLNRKRQKMEDSLYEVLKKEFEIDFEGG